MRTLITVTGVRFKGISCIIRVLWLFWCSRLIYIITHMRKGIQHIDPDIFNFQDCFLAAQLGQDKYVSQKYLLKPVLNKLLPRIKSCTYYNWSRFSKIHFVFYPRRPLGTIGGPCGKCADLPNICAPYQRDILPLTLPIFPLFTCTLVRCGLNIFYYCYGFQ